MKSTHTAPTPEGSAAVDRVTRIVVVVVLAATAGTAGLLGYSEGWKYAPIAVLFAPLYVLSGIKMVGAAAKKRRVPVALQLPRSLEAEAARKAPLRKFAWLFLGGAVAMLGGVGLCSFPLTDQVAEGSLAAQFLVAAGVFSTLGGLVAVLASALVRTQPDVVCLCATPDWVELGLPSPAATDLLRAEYPELNPS